MGGKICCGGTSVSWYMGLTCAGGESTDDESLFGLNLVVVRARQAMSRV